VARETADLVLLDDDFASIVSAVRLGRRIRDNLRKATAYIFAVHVPTAGLSLLPVLLGWPLVLLPAHIAFLELIIDPACSIVFEAEAEESDVMRRAPRTRAALFDRQTVGLGLLQGAGVLAAVLAIYGVALYRGVGEGEARAVSFTTLVIANLALILTNRSWSRGLPTILRTPNAALWWVVGGTALFLTLVLAVPSLRMLFRFSALPAEELAFCVVAGLSCVLWFEGYKWLRRRR